MKTVYTQPQSLRRSLLFACLFFLISIIQVFAQNPIVTENALTGSPPSVWDVSGAGDLSIQGFATDISVEKGNTVHFKIKTDASAYTIEIYRLGYYQGNGARHVGTGVITASLPQTQPTALYDASTGLTDCGNWAESAHWDVPSTAVSGVYIAKLTRTDNGGASHIVFIVRDDTSHSDLYFQTSDATWQAYNVYGGNSLYVGSTSYPSGHAAKVSYNRPFITRDGGGGGGAAEDWLFNAEYPMIRWLERNGYDVTYTTDLDDDRYGSLILNHKVFLSVGHDEYWSAQQLANVVAARDAGVNLAFFSGNEIYWKTRWENSTDGSNTPYRTLVCYKEGTLGENACGGKCDPLANVWTGLWRDGCSYPAADGCRPENAVSGQISWDGSTGTIEVPDTYKNLRFWRNTSIASLAPGATATLTSGTLGYEWDWQQYQSYYPPGRVLMSSTTLNSHVHHLSLYRASSGALVFGAGTVQWAWGLDDNHDRGSAAPSADMQQATVNLLADMGAQPATLQSGLVTATMSTDTQAPVSVITSPNGAVLPNGNTTTITGTASDNVLVAGVDISLDSGKTWKPASGTTNWSFTWTPTVQGPIKIMSRGFDDSGNLESAATVNNEIVDTIAAPGPVVCPCNVFSPLDTPATPLANDNGQGIELGMKFRTSENGYITGVRFYKGAGTVGTHLGHLWSSGGLLAEVSFTNETASGWQEAYFGTPVPIVADSTYIISYHSSSGDYCYTDNYFTSAVTHGPITALADGTDGPNGVYRYGSEPAYPTNYYEASNYWVDVIFATSVGPDTIPPYITTVSPTPNATGVNISSTISATFNEALDVSTVNTSTCLLTDVSNNPVTATVSYNPGTHTAIINPSSALAYSTTYKVTMKGGTGYDRIKDVAGNAFPADSTWTFTTQSTPPPPPPPPADGPGGPILLISAASNPFSRYPVEILRAEGFNEFDAMDISTVDNTVLNNHQVVILGEMPLTGAEVTMLTNWVNAGGTLIAFRPDAQLASLLGLTSAGGTLSNGYILVNTASGPGAGIVSQTMQFHGTADYYTLNGATSLATLYSDASTATSYPAVTTNDVGSNGGKAIAFTYDLAKSVVYTRQGNPAWAGQKRDGQIDPIRPDDQFYPDWIDFNKIAIPQADEQQHLLSNIITQDNLHNMPLPRFWFLPKGLKAAIVMTGDNHGDAGMQPRFDIDLSESDPGCSVDDWDCIRSTGYLYVGSIFTDAMARHYDSLGFEVALHVNTGCANFTQAEYENDITTQVANFASTFPDIPIPTTNRNHCIAWSGWSMTAEVEAEKGIRLDANYYYWPGSWVNNRAGFFTGSGVPMRFAKEDGTIIDCYQLVTQMPDESDEIFPDFCDSLLDRALDSRGYYGVFTTNMHFDNPDHPGANAVVASAKAHNIPVVTAKQMLTWLDGRNNSYFGALSWNTDTLKFSVTAALGSRNLNGMLPVHSSVGDLQSLLQNGTTPVTYSIQKIKGMDYAFFPTSGGNYDAIYNYDTTPPVITNVNAVPHIDGTATITWNTNELADSKVIYGLSSGALTSGDSNAVQVTGHNIVLGGLTLGATYYYRVISKDGAGNTATSPNPSAPYSFIMPSAPCASDVTAANFDLGTPDANTAVTLNDDGEVILKPALYNDFSGSSIPAGWRTGAWNPGGGATVSGGTLNVDGGSASTIATFGPGTSLEFKATFSNETFQNVGFSADSAFNPPWVTIGEGTTSGNLYARDDLNTEVPLGSGLVGAPHYFRIDWTPTGFIFYVDSVQVATMAKNISSNMLVMASDFNTGGNSLHVDWLRVTPYASSGSYTSRVFDHGGATTWGQVDWTAYTPTGTAITINVRTGNTPTPDGTWTSFFPVSNGISLDTIAQYLQYRADLSTSNSALTPSLNDINISCTSGVTCTPPFAYISAVNASTCVGNNVALQLDSATGTPPYQLVVNGNTYNNVNPGQIFATFDPAETSIWGNTGTPSNANGNDAQPIEVGIKFRASENGYVTGVRFYKGSSNTGIHIGDLWSRNGTKLASATFTNETASGWQQVRFTTPVYIHADTTYIASYYSVGGTFAITPFYFSSSGVTNGPLTALQAGVDGVNGVYVYGGGFPSGGNDANYWADVLFEPAQSSPDILNYTLTDVTDNNNCTDTMAVLSTTSVQVNPSPGGVLASAGTICKGQDIQLVYSSTAGTGPFSLNINDTTYNGISSGVPFTTGQSAATHSIWSNSVVPGTLSVTVDSEAIELGVKFRSSVAGEIKGIRFYKGAANKGTHTGSLWSSSGTLLATATFTSETASGWQQVLFSSPVNIAANTTYIASYHADSGRYAFDTQYFSGSGVTNGPLTALQNGVDGSNGVYIYSTGGVFPNQSYNAANYWVDVIFVASGLPTYTLSGVTDANGCSTIISGNTVSINQVDSVTASITSKTDVTCNGGSDGTATVTASGGSGGYHYLWSDVNTQTTATASGLAAGTYTVTVTDSAGCGMQVSDTVVIGQATSVNAVATHQDAACNGSSTGWVTVSASGGTGPYTYLWSNTATTDTIKNLAAGIYSVTVTDSKGCTAQAKDTVKEPTAVSTQMSHKNVACNGGNSGWATVVASGGTGPYTYLWSNAGTTDSISSLYAGAYTVAVTDAHGCTHKDSVIVSQAGTLLSSYNVYHVSCNGGSDGAIKAVVTGGATPYSYLWAYNGSTADSVSGLSAGSYSVTITDFNGCQINDLVAVTQPVNPLTLQMQELQKSCANDVNGAASVTASGGTGPYTYLWSNGGSNDNISGVAAGTYSVTVTDAKGCSNSGSVTINANPVPVVMITGNVADGMTICQGKTDTLTAHVTGTGPFAYSWNTGSTNNRIMVTTANTYSVTVTDGNGCSNTGTGTVTVNPLPVVSISGDTTVCTGSSTTLTAAGAASYSWSTGQTTSSLTVSPPADTNYVVVCTAGNGCAVIKGVNITVNPLPLISISGNNIICAGGTATVTASGANTYSWSNGTTGNTLNVSPPGDTSYAVICTDANGCQKTKVVGITVEPLPVVTITSVPANFEVCAGDPVILTAHGAIAYNWSNGIVNGVPFIPVSTNQYYVEGIDANGCRNNDAVNVTVNPIPVIIISGRDSIQNGSSDTLIASGASTYAWSTGSNNDTTIVSPTSTTTYTVTGVSMNGCRDSTSFTVTVNIYTMLSNTTKEDQSMIYPNPALEQVFLKFGLQGSALPATVRIINSIGKEVMQRRVTITNGTTVKLNVSGLASGVYFIRLETGDGVRIAKLIKQ